MSTKIPSTLVYNNLHFHINSCIGKYYVLIEDLYVAPEDRRKGEGRKLLKAAIQEALEKGYEIYIHACPSFDYHPIPCPALVEFYASEGFVIDCTTDRGVMMKYKGEKL